MLATGSRVFKNIKTKGNKVRSITHHGKAFSSDNRVIIMRGLEEPLQGITLLELNRHNRRNAINFPLILRLNELIKEIKLNPSIQAVILTSRNPGMFCAGADLKERIELQESEYRRWSWSTRDLFNQLEGLPMPVLAAMDGFALGGGLEMALACDIRVAAQNVKLGFPETGLAIIPGTGGTQRLPRLIGASAAKELILTSRILNGKEAYNLGLVNHVVHQNDAGDAAYRKCLTLASEIVKRNSEFLKTAKKEISNSMDLTF